MKAARIIAIAVLLVGSGLVLHAAQVQQPGIKRTDALRHDLGILRQEVVQVRVDFPPGVLAARHSLKWLTVISRLIIR